MSIEQGIVVKNYTIVTEFAKKYSYLVTKSKRLWVFFVTNTYEIRQILGGGKNIGDGRSSDDTRLLVYSQELLIRSN